MSEELVDVRNFTLKCVCRLFCSNQCEVPLALGYLAHVVRIVTSALTSGISSTISIVIQSTKHIFSLDYRGLLALIPTYLEQIHKILDVKSDFSSKAKSAAISLLGSLLSIPDHYGKYEVPIIGKPDKMTMPQVKDLVYQELLSVLHNQTDVRTTDKTHLKFVNKAISCAAVIVYQETAKQDFDTPLIKVQKIWLKTL